MYSNHTLLFETRNEMSLDEVNALVKKELGGQWTVRKLGKWLPHYQASPPEPLSVKDIWNSAHKLAGEAFRYVEPDVHQPGQGISMMGSFFDCDGHKKDTDKIDWAIRQINVPAAWKEKPKQPGGKQYGEGIRVALPDTGWTMHKEIWNNHLLIKEGWNYVEDNGDTRDTGKGPLNKGHGTATAALILSGAKDGKVIGVAPLSYVIPIRIDDWVTLATNVRLLQAIDLAIDRGCHIISMSLGTLHNPEAINSALKRAVDHGIIPVAAAGQFAGLQQDIWPASSPYCVCCTGSNILDNPWHKSLKSQYIDIAAPAESVTATYNKLFNNQLEEGTDRFCGTSFSTALVAGCAAVWYGYWSPQYLHSRFGKAKVFAVFLNALKKFGARKPRNWNTRDFGPGIMDLLGLLTEKTSSPQAESMPDADPDQLMEERLDEYPQDALEHLLAALPEESREKVRDFLATKEDHNTPAKRESLLRELRYQVRSSEGFAAQLEVISTDGPRLESMAATDGDVSEPLSQFLNL